ncbi:MAG: hypothetical protein RL684_1170, partial [Pseudomonadota bacterium]
MARITRRELIQGVAAAGVVPALLVHAGAADAASVALAGRGSTRLDFDWRFKLGHASDPARDFDWGSYQRTYAKSGEHTATAAQLAFDDSDWAAVQLPHDWAVGLPFAPSSGADAAAEEDPRAAHGYKPVGREFPETSVGWYRLRLDVPAADLGRAISLEFDGVFRDCLVFCNGHVVGRNESGYAPFRVELGDFLEYGATNLIAVRVDASLGEGWFYEGAGIYRPVRLVKTAPLHIPQWGVQVIARVEGAAASLSVETQLVNDGVQAQGVRLVSEVLAADGHVLAQHASDAPPLAAGESRTLRQSLRLDHAVLWSVEQPHLYRLRSRVLVGSTELDAVETPFGVRTVRFDAQQGFFLNGQPLKLQGTCNHQDHAGVGAAMPDALIDWRVQRLKALGSNAYRSAHNPPSSALLEACDRHGLLVIDEVRLMSSDDEALGQLERMIRRDRNHPSVILWSLGNEEPQMVRDRGARIVRRMK